jgi:hypothetical protein
MPVPHQAQPRQRVLRWSSRVNSSASWLTSCSTNCLTNCVN